MPSLEHIALVKVVAALWNGYNARALIEEFSFPLQEVGKIDAWEKIEAGISQKVPQLSLPELLHEKVLGIIKPIGLEIFKWMEYHCRGSFFYINLPNELCWTPQGTIDRRRTAQMLVRGESLDVTMRYKLACIYFLEDDIWKLWNEIPEARNNAFFYEEYPTKEEHQWKTVCVWTKEMKQEWNRGMSLSFSYQSLIGSCAEEGNKAAAEYFLPKLPPRERDISLATTVDYTQDPLVLWYLLCEMNDKQQIEVLKEYHYKVLQCFLNWPLQGLFMETANRVWELLTETQLYWLLLEIAQKINANYKDCDYEGLFGELWQKMSEARKSHVVGKILNTNSCGWHILQWLFKIKDEEKIREFFQLASPTQKKEFMFCSGGLFFFRTLIGVGEMRLLRLLLDECLSTEDEMTEFLEEFEAHIMQCCPIDELYYVIQLLDDLTSKYT